MSKNLNFKKCLKESMTDLPIDMGDMYSEFERDVHKALDKIMDNYAVYNASNEDLKIAINSFIKKNTVNESFTIKENSCSEDKKDTYFDDEIDECIHNHYDVETAHEFMGLDDTTPRARSYSEEEIKIDYDDEF